MIREHPRFQRTAIIFISAIHLSDVDRLFARLREAGAVDYVPVPVIPGGAARQGAPKDARA
jgi:CheY-like chemotaxis protein